MRIFYDKKTGKVVGTVDGFRKIPDGVRVVPGGSNPEDIGYEDIELGSPKEQLARDLMSPRHPLQIDILEFDGEIKEMSAEKKAKVFEAREKRRQEAQERLEKQPKQSLEERFQQLEEKLKNKEL